MASILILFKRSVLTLFPVLSLFDVSIGDDDYGQNGQNGQNPQNVEIHLVSQLKSVGCASIRNDQQGVQNGQNGHFRQNCSIPRTTATSL